MSRHVDIGGRRIGAGAPVFIVAEISANHHQSFDEAMKLIQVARDVGADAVKLQTYTADTLTLRSDRPEFRIGGGTVWDGQTMYELYAEAYTPWEWQPKLKEFAGTLGMPLFSTPFDESAVQFLEEMAVPAYKIASFELVDLPLIRAVARTGKPVIMSTGMATLPEIEEAVAAARTGGASGVALLKCTSSYPAPADEANLRTISDLAERFDVPAGLSDHTMGIAVPVAAVAMGACILEKHLTLSRSVSGPDSAFSLEPDEFRATVDAVRIAEKAAGEVRYGPSPHEAASLAFRRSLFVVEDIREGELFTKRNVRSIRPAHGLHTRHYEEVVGRRAARDIERGTPLSWDLVQKS